MSTAPVTGYGNHYFRVVAPFEVLVKVGLEPAQVYLGTAQALQDLYEPVSTRPGDDEIHALVGGDFLVRATPDGFGVEAYAFDTRRFAASEVMLHPAPPMPKLPADALEEIPAGQAARGVKYGANRPQLGVLIKVLP